MIPRSLSVLLLLLSFSFAFGKGNALRISVENPASFPRAHETIEVPLVEVFRTLGAVDTSSIMVTELGGDTALRAQVDGSMLLFQTTLAPHGTKEFVVRAGTPKHTVPASLVDGRYVLPREDYAWENDRMAFRMYGPALAAEVNNGIDVWTKRVNYLIVKKWYKESESSPPGKDSYHQDRGEGADFFEVGKSLGAGGSGLWIAGSLRQPGVFVNQRTIADGPIRVKFELSYRWVLEGRDTLTERKVISLDAGQNLNKVEVRFEGRRTPDSLVIACGLVKRANTHLTKDPERHWIALWGLTNSDTVNGSLGTGIVIAQGTYAQFTEDASQFLVLTPSTHGSPFLYYAGAGWTRHGDIQREGDWIRSLVNKAGGLNAPLLIRYSRLD